MAASAALVNDENCATIAGRPIINHMSATQWQSIVKIKQISTTCTADSYVFFLLNILIRALDAEQEHQLIPRIFSDHSTGKLVVVVGVAGIPFQLTVGFGN